MSDPYDHNQLATLSEVAITYDREGGAFTFERAFDFSRSPQLDADAVAETWREMLNEQDYPFEVGVEVSDASFILRFSGDGVETRHDLKPWLLLLADELLLTVATHDAEQAREHAEATVDRLSEMERWE